MKSLYESILKSVNAGKREKKKKWCQEHNPFAGNWEITKDDEIACTQVGNTLILPFDTFSELPDYIQFKDDNILKVMVGVSSYANLNINCNLHLMNYYW